ncbi:MAG TPA: M14 family zinc carboxypeptidase [Candidatus Hydrogenedentes bacterium]|nr:M14 family zinc carboxypeptidase [Candidatus Hydrogenedentota bacterium]HOL77169.1 M14 family zinc carboxypeptidase [Candidatus Hydrogenedentota bacterium]HPO85892.1 M14 family zinc carboxypeptidase [Candidatus Hydrogenedentota bacterium]
MTCRWHTKGTCKTFPLETGLLFFLLVGCLLCGSEAFAGGADSVGSTFMGSVTISAPTDVDVLENIGVSVGSVKGNRVVIFGERCFLSELAQAGFEVYVFPQERQLEAYPTYDEISATLEDWVTTHADIARLFSLGQSVEGREIWAVLITDNPDVEEEEPEFRYVGAIHGNETPSAVVCLNFIQLLLEGYGTDPRIAGLVDETAIWVVPLMNPDGYERGTRNNANGVDLNRSFPKYPDDFTGTVYSGAPLLDTGRQPETAALMRWAKANSFVLSANFHTGTLVANYPYDDDGKPSGTYSAAPDDALFRWLALQYASNNPDMFASSYFPQGITNGAAWYVVRGGMQDWMYRYMGCCEITIEISDAFQPPSSQLETLWQANGEAMLAYLEAIHIGVRGLVKEKDNGLPLFAKVMVSGNSQPVFTDPDVGDYYRLLLPGEYTLTFSSKGYRSVTVTGVRVEEGKVTRWDVYLEPDSSGEGSPPSVCPAEKVFQDDPEMLSGLRMFRDNVLAKSLAGRWLITGYYQWAPGLNSMFQNSPVLRQIFRWSAVPFAEFGLSLAK